MNGRSIGLAVAPVLGMFALAGGMALVLQLCGCGSKVDPKAVSALENGAAVAQYDQLLGKCQEEAARLPQADRFDGYIRCEKQLSRSLCEQSPELRETWTRCKEVLP